MSECNHDFPHLADDSEAQSSEFLFWNSRYVPTPRPWMDIFSSPDRLFPNKAWISDPSRQASGRLLQMLDDFPELLSAFTGLLLRNLDFMSIIRVSRCCKALRHLGQDPATWRLLSFLTWGACSMSELALYGGSWRRMFIVRPRPRTDGAYIFKWNTVRYGTNEGRGTKEAGKDYYRPVSILCMIRIMIFCHGRRVAMITTNTNAVAPEALGRALRKLSADSLKKRTTKADKSGLGVVTLGSYEMVNDEITSCWSYTPPQFPGMKPVHISYKHSVVSDVPGANNTLKTLEHITGRVEDGTLHVLSGCERPFTFVAFAGDFTRKMLEIEGWPDCDIQGFCATHKVDTEEHSSAALGASGVAAGGTGAVACQ